jgi:hypothetical protein
MYTFKLKRETTDIEYQIKYNAMHAQVNALSAHGQL